MRRLCFVLLFFGIGHALFSQTISLRPGLTINRSVRVIKKVYRLAAPADSSRSLILIEGNNIVIDFGGAELKGNQPNQLPDSYAGTAILVRNSKSVVLKNLKASGYKIALIVRNSEKLTLDNCDFSYNYRQQLNSTQEKEDISDWMSYHHNEHDEWLRYGAAIYLKDCRNFTVRNCKVTGGQNALMMMRCNNGKIYNNDFSFNSGIGIGMYRCNANEISFNRLNFNVRGYSHGVYNRGQDSAGILIYEQSRFNIFYKNSVTHGGDGFFLWAGQTTMDTGEGGCNDNLVLQNDFSYAPTNGVEVTFSRLRVEGNRIFECDHGIWGGYSYASKFNDNQFRNNRIGIAIEHGQHNEILGNLFIGDREAIKLWSRKQQPSDWGYARYRDTRSVGYTIAGNSFNSNPVVYSLTGTDSLHIFSNTTAGAGAVFRIDSSVTHLDSATLDMIDSTLIIPRVPLPKDPFAANGKFAGRKNIMITSWGPYDFRYPIVWNTNPADSSKVMKFDILGPRGNWSLKSVKGLKNVSAEKGVFPAQITAEKEPGAGTDIVLELLYQGAAFTNAFGETVPSGKPWSFAFKKYFQPIDWQVLFYPVDTLQHNPIRSEFLFSLHEKKAPFRSEKKDRLDYAWWGGITEAGINHPQFLTLAEGAGEFRPAEYELSVTWDDAVRVYVDGRLVIDEWNPSTYDFDESPHRKVRLRLGGSHQFRVEHVELGGFATLSLKISPVE